MSLLLALLAAAQTPPAPQPEPPPPPPADWSIVPPLPWRTGPRRVPEHDAFVERAIAAERCPVTGTRLSVEVAVLIRSDGIPRVVVPRAIDCPAVEQYAAGLVSALVRNNIRLPASGWYRTTLTFDWTR